MDAKTVDYVTEGADARRRWYLVFTKPRQEEVARTNLERQGYRIYLPMTRQTRRRAGRRLHVHEPFFPRYLFIHLDTATDNWSPIRSTVGVTSLVRFGPDPTPVPDALVDELVARENAEGLQEIPSRLQSGDGVRIADGPLMGYEGIFVAPTGEERVIVLLNIMGKQARVQVDADALAKLG